MTEMTLQSAVEIAKSHEAAGDNDKALNILRSLYNQVPTSDMASLYATALCRVGGRDDEGMRTLIRRHPENKIIRAAFSEMRLQDGDYETGFFYCPARWAVAKTTSVMPQIPCERWRGDDFDGDLIVVGEQGLGEEILYLSNLDKINRRAIIAADPRLHPLIARSFPQHIPAHKSVVRYFATPKHRKIEAMELTGLLETTGNSKRWLLPNHRQAEAMQAALHANAPGKTIVGLSWFSAREKIGDDKSIPREAILPLLKDDRLSVVNLQYGDTSQDVNWFASNGGQLNEIEGLNLTGDIDGLASLIAACDVVVTCSNTTAHLSGALGKRTILIAPGNRFVMWFWGNGDRTAWYPSIEIIRARHGWNKAVAQAVEMI